MRTLLVVAVVVVVLLGLLWLGQRTLIYLPDTSPVPPAASVISGAQDLTLRTEDGVALGAWFIPAEDADMAVLVANGNAGNRESRVPFAAALRDAGLSVLLFDYRGYGDSGGRPSEDGLAMDARAALDALTGELGFPQDRVLYYGESLGTGVVTELALNHPPAGLVLRSPYTDLADLGRVHYPFLPVRPLLRDRFPTIDRIGGIDAPATVVYGTADTVVPPDQSRAVAAAAGNLFEEVSVEGADHNDAALFTGSELIDAVQRLAEHVDPD